MCAPLRGPGGHVTLRCGSCVGHVTLPVFADPVCFGSEHYQDTVTVVERRSCLGSHAPLAGGSTPPRAPSAEDGPPVPETGRIVAHRAAQRSRIEPCWTYSPRPRHEDPGRAVTCRSGDAGRSHGSQLAPVTADRLRLAPEPTDRARLSSVMGLFAY